MIAEKVVREHCGGRFVCPTDSRPTRLDPRGVGKYNVLWMFRGKEFEHETSARMNGMTLKTALL